MNEGKRPSGFGFGVAGLAMVACCGGPLLLAAGVLGTVGGFLGNPVVIAVAALLVLGTILWAADRRARGRAPSCPPEEAAIREAGRVQEDDRLA